MSEKRRHVRVHREARVAFNAAGHTVEATTTDISSSGMRVVAAFGGETGQLDGVVVSFPDLDEAVRIPARITHFDSRESERVIGLQFEFQSETQRALVDSYVRAAKEREILDYGPRFNSRRLPRAACSIETVEAEHSTAHFERVENVSTDGFLVSYQGELNAGERFAMRFYLPGDVRPLNAEVFVVYTNHNLFGRNATAGLRIEQIGEVDRTRVRNFIVASSSGGTVRTVHSWIAQQGLSGSYHVTDLERVDRYFRLLVTNDLLLHLMPAHGHEIRTGVVTRLDPVRRRMTLSISTGPPVEPGETTLFGSFVADAGSFFFSAPLVEVNEAVLACELPDRLFRSEQRSYGRKMMDADSEFALVLDDPQGSEIPGRLVDISRRGFLCELPADADVLQKLRGLESVRYRGAEGLGLDTEGEIRHLHVGGADGDVVRIGVEAGIRRSEAETHTITDDQWATLPVYSNEVGFLGLPGAASRAVRYQDAHGRTLCALVNSIGIDAGQNAAHGLEAGATLFILPPAFGKKKEALAPLAATLMANFVAVGRPVVIVRYDGTDRPGESDSEDAHVARGYEMLHYRISNGKSDLQATLDWAMNTTLFRAQKVVLVTFSMSALDARKVLTDELYASRVDFWISAMGVPAAQSALRSTLGGLDVIGNYKMGIPSGVCGLLGHLVDMDRIAQDLVDQRYAYITDARVDMASIPIPILWLYGRHDMWVTPTEVEDIMSVTSPGSREILQIPAGHNLRTSDDAVRAFKLIARRSCTQLFGEGVTPVDPRKDDMLELIAAERERLVHHHVPAPEEYWRDYLVGRGEPGSGYDFYRNLTDFRFFLKRQVELLDVRSGMSVADMGCGTGLYLEQLFQFHGASNGGAENVSVTAVDLVSEALERARAKLDAVCAGSGAPTGWTVRYLQQNLEPSRLLPVKELLEDSGMPLARLRGRIKGLTGAICHEFDSCGGEEVGRYARAEIDSAQVSKTLAEKEFSPAALEALHDLNVASRWLRGAVAAGSVGAQFKRLSFGSLETALHYPFADASFDRINASLFISYLFNPQYAIGEFHRLLRPGGRLVVSSMRPDSDISVIFTDYVEEVSRSENDESSLRDAREMLNEAAELFELEEEGYFRFFDAYELAHLVSATGLQVVSVEQSLGDPPQAVVVTAEKEGGVRGA